MRKFIVYVNGQPFEVLVEETGGQVPSFTPAYTPPTFVPQQPVQAPPPPPVVRQAPASAPAPRAAAPAPAPAPAKPAPKQEVKVEGGASVNAPMPGAVVDIKVKVGDSVKDGDVLLVLEAMKMENEITAPSGGKVKSVNVQKGATVNTGDLLVVIA
jgi:biotin carboxyl carrier protein